MSREIPFGDGPPGEDWLTKTFAERANEKNSRMEEALSAGLQPLLDKLDLHTRAVDHYRKDHKRVLNQIDKTQKTIEELETQIGRLGADKERYQGFALKHEERVKKAEEGLRKEKKKVGKFREYVELRSDYLMLEDSSEDEMEGVEHVQVQQGQGGQQQQQAANEDEEFDGL